LKNREATAIGKLHENEARRGKGVTREAQDIFDAISRTMPVRWDGTNIVVADAVSIAAPYRPDDCRPLVAGDTAALLRVRKVVRIRIIFFFSRMGFMWSGHRLMDRNACSLRWNARRLSYGMPAPPFRGRRAPRRITERRLRIIPARDRERRDRGRGVE
jgi:hypothetical protein